MYGSTIYSCDTKIMTFSFIFILPYFKLTGYSKCSVFIFSFGNDLFITDFIFLYV